MALRPDIGPDDWTYAEFCAGTGMLGVAVELAFEMLGIRSVPVVYCEREACAAASLVARMEATGLGFAPVWDNLATFDGRPWRGLVDVACAGLPCPAYSHAGLRTGNADERAWGEDGISGPVPQFLRVVGEMRPAVVWLENVPAWVADGWFRPVGDELSRLGYTIADPLFIGAEDVGAPHGRQRVFVLVYNGCQFKHLLQRSLRSEFERGGDLMGIAGGPRSEGPGHPGAVGERRPAPADDAVGHAQRDGGRGEQPRRGADRRAAGGRPGQAMGDAERDRRPEHIRQPWTDGQSDPADCGLPLFPPGPGLGLVGVVDGPRGILQLFGEDPQSAWACYQAELGNTLRWRGTLMSNPEVEPGVPGLVDGLVADADALRLGGNGVVPLAAAYAFATLLDEVIADVKR